MFLPRYGCLSKDLVAVCLSTVCVVISWSYNHYSTLAMKAFGRNNIAILATLFLLSYSKILKTIITALTFTEILESQADNVTAPFVPHKVWTYDGNIDYLKGKHISLFYVSLAILLFLFLPYTLGLIFGQCLRSMSSRKGFIWIRGTAFISIMDAYHAPYNKRHRYWTGLMLLTRCFLFLVFATNYKDNAILTNMYTITLVISGILAIKTCTTKIYKNFHLNTLELCFLLNLEVVSATLHYLKGKEERDSTICKSVTASISIAFIMFIGILVYHAYLRLVKTRYYMSIERALLNTWRKQQCCITLVEEASGESHNTNVEINPPTRTWVELRESLLDSS